MSPPAAAVALLKCRTISWVEDFLFVAFLAESWYSEHHIKYQNYSNSKLPPLCRGPHTHSNPLPDNWGVTGGFKPMFRGFEFFFLHVTNKH